ELTPPSCSKRAENWQCTFQYAVEHDVASAQNDFARGILSAVTGAAFEPSAVREQNLMARVSRHDFDWSPLTLEIAQHNGRLRSSAADAALADLAKRLEKMRLDQTARASAANSGSPDSSMCDSLRAGAAASPSGGVADSFYYQYMC